jgi:hypothetical protein
MLLAEHPVPALVGFGAQQDLAACRHVADVSGQVILLLHMQCELQVS